ncbi:reverse transcriptase [Phytophthora cinnamomi]|uniref:reverse transcriptase n=1 Tax=Phytophthora cinnamomi TaxID=4785 RepID=UPI0035596FBF|nr:reverse transcriptase [Phytophthora cinnamomi]
MSTEVPMESSNTPATHVARADRPHLSDPEWEALQRLSTVIGEAAIATMLRTLSPTEQHGVALGFIMKEQRDAASSVTASSGTTPRAQPLKLSVSDYVGREGEPLLRWLVELDTAIAARRIVDPLSKVAFAMSCLGGRARSWAYGRRLSDPTCFSTYEVFKEEIKQAFEPPQNEFRSRAEFLDLQQGKHDVHAYAQRARYLVSNIVTNPIDEATKVVTFMKGLRDGPVKTYLFREYPSTLEAAITLAMQEEFSLRQAMLPTSEEKDVLVPGTNTHVQACKGQSLTRSGQVDNDASAPEADAPSVMRGSANEWRRGDEGVSTPGVDAANSADGCKRTALTQFACCRAAGLHDEAPCDQAGLDIARPQTGSAGEGTHYRAAGLHEGKCGQAGLDTARPRTESAGERLSKAGPGQGERLCGAGLRTTRRRRKRKTLRKSRSGTETQQGQSAGQTAAVTPNVKTLSVLTRTDTGFQYRDMELASPPTTASELTSLPAMSWNRFTRDLHDGRIEQVCVLSNSERTASESEELRQLFMGSTTESEDTLSAKTKRERFEEQGWDSLKSSPYCELLREYKDVLPEEIPAELPQDKGIQHEIDLVPGTKYCVTRQ